MFSRVGVKNSNVEKHLQHSIVRFNVDMIHLDMILPL